MNGGTVVGHIFHPEVGGTRAGVDVVDLDVVDIGVAVAGHSADGYVLAVAGVAVEWDFYALPFVNQVGVYFGHKFEGADVGGVGHHAYTECMPVLAGGLPYEEREGETVERNIEQGEHQAGVGAAVVVEIHRAVAAVML